jgi:hypothetical protein
MDLFEEEVQSPAGEAARFRQACANSCADIGGLRKRDVSPGD